MKCFVTGATGFIGGHLVRQLVQAGHQVVAIARTPSRATGLAHLGVDVRPGDVTDRESLRRPMEGVEAVFHVAGWYRVGARDKHLGQSVNVDGTRHILEVMRDLAIPRGVYTSSLAVFSDTRGRLVDETYRHHGPWLSEYDRTKWVAHYQVAEPMIQAGLPLVIVQPGAVYGPGDRGPMGIALLQYLQGKLLAVPQRTGICWGHVEDTARAHILALERGRPGESYIVAGPPHTLVEALEMAERLTGVRAPRLRPPPAAMKALAAAMSLVERVVPVPETYAAETLRVAAGVTYWGSSDKARRELGLQMRPLEEGLRETLRHEMRHLGRHPSPT